MRRGIGLLIGAMLPAVAMAQSSQAITATPLQPPNSMAAPTPEQPPEALPAPEEAPAQPGSSAEQPGPAAPQPMQLTWVPQGSAQVQVLDKVNAQSKVLTLRVGQQGQYGSLTIHVQACDTHPPTEPQDSAAYLTITDNHADAPGFQGWMLANEPSASALQHPVYDVRVIGCGT